jgi:AcrR family transcriptional regulator
MEKRAAAVEETRRRILEATMALHREKGIVGTGFQDVARRADVAVGTVYRHFPTLEELVAACGQATAEWLALPAPEDVPALFRGTRANRERVERLVGGVGAIYRRAAVAFLRVREARGALRPAAEGHEAVERLIDAFVDEALRPTKVGPEHARAVRALLDARFWDTLVDRGLGEEEAERTLVELVLCAVDSGGAPPGDEAPTPAPQTRGDAPT